MIMIKIAPKLWIKQINPNQYTVGDIRAEKGMTVYHSNMRYFPNLDLAARYCCDKLALRVDEIRTVEKMAQVYKDAADRVTKAVKGVQDES